MKLLNTVKECSWNDLDYFLKRPSLLLSADWWRQQRWVPVQDLHEWRDSPESSSQLPLSVSGRTLPDLSLPGTYNNNNNNNTWFLDVTDCIVDRVKILKLYLAELMNFLQFFQIVFSGQFLYWLFLTKKFNWDWLWVMGSNNNDTSMTYQFSEEPSAKTSSSHDVWSNKFV